MFQMFRVVNVHIRLSFLQIGGHSELASSFDQGTLALQREEPVPEVVLRFVVKVDRTLIGILRAVTL